MTPSATLTPPEALPTYEAMASCYDAFTAHHDYELWLGNLLPVLEHYGLHRGDLLDVACGTGKSFLPMLTRGWRVTAVDLSPAMVDRARAKVGDRVRFEVADMRKLGSLGRFDLVWCLDDAVNYLLDRVDLVAALSSFRRNLAPGGLCMFDTNTLASYRGFFASTEQVRFGDLDLIWRGRTSRAMRPGGLACAELEISKGKRTVKRIVHRQRHFLPEEITAAIAAAGLELVAVRGHGPEVHLEEPLDEARHTKAIFLAMTGERR